MAATMRRVTSVAVFALFIAGGRLTTSDRLDQVPHGSSHGYVIAILGAPVSEAELPADHPINKVPTGPTSQLVYKDEYLRAYVGLRVVWTTDHVEGSEPLNHFRGSEKDGTLTVYYRRWDHDHLHECGFHDPEQPAYVNQKVKVGVELTCQPPRRTLYGMERALKIELPEDLLLPYEWAHETDWLYRVFRVPASMLNRTLRYGESRDDTASDSES
jgi:hypothetical protein